MNTIEVLRKLSSETKAEVYFVGGYVRDYLRNRKNHDLDIVVRNLSPRNIKRFLRKYGELKEIVLSQTSDDIMVKILLFKAFDDTQDAQISLPKRSKRCIPDSRNTLRQDVRFRDFKLNSMYLPIDYKSKDDLIDYVDGRKDIFNRVITANGSPKERIKESPIRMLRAISIATRLNYNVDTELLEAIEENATLIKKCPIEAIRTEFDDILLSRKPSKYLKLLLKTGLLKIIAPEVHSCVGVKQDLRYHKYDVFTHLIYTVDNCDKNLVLRLAGLLHDIGKYETKRITRIDGERKITFHKHEVVSGRLATEFLSRMKYDKETSKSVLLLVRQHMYHYTREWTDPALRKFIRKVDIEPYIKDNKVSEFPLFKLRAAERLGNGLKTDAITQRQKDFEDRLIRVYEESTGLNISDLKINGTIIMDTFNIKPGVEVGRLLQFLLEKVLEEPKVNNELDLLKLATEYLHSKRKENN